MRSKTQVSTLILCFHTRERLIHSLVPAPGPLGTTLDLAGVSLLFTLTL